MHLMISCFEKGWATIPQSILQFNDKAHCVKDPSTSYHTETNLSTDERQT